jgi:HAD superfamily hydrolase (TIGR01509 family)
MKFKGAIFDMDGTLLDSMPVWFDIGSEFLRQNDYIPQEDLNKRIKSMSLEQSAEYLIKEYHINESVNEIIGRFNKQLERHYKASIPLKPGVEQLLKRLRKNKIKMCVATATDIRLAEAALKRLDIIDYFEDIITCGETGMGKDNPEFFLNALKIIATSISETIVFEDALYAIRSAKSAGFLVAGIYDESAFDDADEIKSLVDLYLNSYDQWKMNFI